MKEQDKTTEEVLEPVPMQHLLQFDGSEYAILKRWMGVILDSNLTETEAEKTLADEILHPQVFAPIPQEEEQPDENPEEKEESEEERDPVQEIVDRIFEELAEEFSNGKSMDTQVDETCQRILDRNMENYEDVVRVKCIVQQTKMSAGMEILKSVLMNMGWDHRGTSDVLNEYNAKVKELEEAREKDPDLSEKERKKIMDMRKAVRIQYNKNKTNERMEKEGFK